MFAFVGTSVDCKKENERERAEGGQEHVSESCGTCAEQTRCEMGALTYAGCHVGARLLIAAGTPVAGQPGDAFLTGTLATQMIAGLASGANGMAVAA